jgi:1-acyl-sn-glycerol-3-phosphate acyltransferase
MAAQSKRERLSSGIASDYTVPVHTRLFRWVFRPVFRGIFHLLSQVQISGTEIIPQGAYIIAINHVSLFEPPFMLAFWPIAPEAVGAVDIWQRRGQSRLARCYGGIPIHRGEYDRQAMARVQAALQSGRPLLISPEGGRSHSLGMRRALPGVAFIIEKANVPVVPVGVVGATDDFLKKGLRGKRPVIEMRIGAPFWLPPIEGKGEQRRRARQRNADLIMQRIALLLPAEYHGVYADQELAAQAE